MPSASNGVFQSFSKQSQLIFAFLSLFYSASPFPLTGKHLHRTETTNQLKEQISAMMTAVDQALNEYIAADMDCSSVEACRTYTTSLRLTALPTSEIVEGTNPDWSQVFENNINGLQDFNYILQNIFNERTVGDTVAHSGLDGLTSTIANLLRDVSTLLSQFVFNIEADLKETFCLEFAIKPLSSYPPCEMCKVSSLPSNSLEVIRNYQFMMQLYNYLSDFLNIYNKFLFLTPTPESC